jgi:hypothetical protein
VDGCTPILKYIRYRAIKIGAYQLEKVSGGNLFSVETWKLKYEPSDM